MNHREDLRFRVVHMNIIRGFWSWFNGHTISETALSYTIGDDNFTEFINNLRGTLASHHEPEDMCPDPPIENKKHPLLAKLRAEQQPARWIQIELKADGNKTSTITLVMRDDNVDVMGFKNQMGWFELGNWRHHNTTQYF